MKSKFTNFTLEVIYTGTIYENIEISEKLTTDFQASLFQWKQLKHLKVEFNLLKVFLHLMLQKEFFYLKHTFTLYVGTPIYVDQSSR